VAQIAHRGGNLYTAFFLWLGGGDKSERRWFGNRQLHLKTLVATPAERVGCAELHQATVVATEYLPLFDGRHHGCHQL